MNYRPDIDGLRCLAVTSVVLYHLNGPLLPGGFTGVDIFFVISGFLITRIIASGLENGGFTIFGFYARRVRRIFPALFSMLFVSAGFAMLALEPEMFERFLGEFRFAALQISNLMFAGEQGYFDVAPETSPLLHTWSLGVEEQFYLIWPFLLALLYRFFRNRLTQVISAIALISFVLSDYLCQVAPQNAYYLLYSRAWELGIGGLLSLGAVPVLQSRKTLNTLAMLGLFCVIWPLFNLDGTAPFPGRNAVLTVFGSAVLLYTGGISTDTLPYRLLSSRPLVAVGLISYSLYLWHWPLIVFYKIATGAEIGLVSGGAIALVSLVCATVSYFLIERPFRYGKIPEPVRARLAAGVGGRLLAKAAVPGLLLIFPVLATLGLLYSTLLEENNAAAELTLEVAVAGEGFDQERERIAIYWADEQHRYSEQDSRSFSYQEASRPAADRYRFSFSLPDLRKIHGLRLDPLLGKGEIAIIEAKLRNWLFRFPKHLSAAEITTHLGPGGLHHLIFRPRGDELILAATGDDPYISMVDDDYAHLEMLLLLLVLFGVGLTLTVSLRLFTVRRPDQGVLAVGAAFIVLTLLFSARMGYSSLSPWRFLQSQEAEKRLAAISYTDISQIPQSDDPGAVLLGDSHAGNYAAPVQAWAERSHRSLKIVALPACPPLFAEIPRIDGKAILSGQYHSCMQRHIDIIDTILQNPHTEYVFLAFRQDFFMANARMFFNSRADALLAGGATCQDLLMDSFSALVRKLLAGNKKVILLGQVPVLKEHPKACLTRNLTILAGPLNNRGDCELDPQYSDARLAGSRQLLSRMADEMANLYYFEPARYVTSAFGNNRELLYYDDNHLNHLGSLRLSPYLVRELSEIDTGQGGKGAYSAINHDGSKVRSSL